jgi:hypothetical protein
MFRCGLPLFDVKSLIIAMLSNFNDSCPLFSTSAESENLGQKQMGWFYRY